MFKTHFIEYSRETKSPNHRIRITCVLQRSELYGRVARKSQVERALVVESKTELCNQRVKQTEYPPELTI